MILLKGAPPIAADPGGIPDFRIFRFFGKCGFWEFSGGIWGLGGLQSIGNGCGIQIHRFSTHFDPYGFFYDFHDFAHFGMVFRGLTLLPGGPRTLQECPEGPGAL